jgi:hypothetical protein
MPLRVLAVLFSTVVSQESPVITGASWAPEFFSRTFPCPPNLPWACNLGATRVTLLGASFGASGVVEVAAPIAPNTPVVIPTDLPDELQLLSLAPFSTNGCLMPSDAASSEYSIEVCPYSTSFLRARGGGPRVASLGAFSGVVRTDSPDCSDPPAPTTQAVTGLLFAGGDVCGSGTRSARVNFVCIDEADPWQERYLRNTTVHAATRSADGCQWLLDIPIAGACSGDNFDLCSVLQTPSPNVSPTPAPSLALSPGFQISWSANTIVVLVQPSNSGPPSALKVRRSPDDATSMFAVPVPEPLPPSFSPVPQPFPTTLTVLGANPNAGLSASDPSALPCNPVIISLAGALPLDLVGFEASFEIIFPRSPLLNNSAETLYGTPLGANATVTQIPPNGRLDLVLNCAPRLSDFQAPFTGNFFLRSRYLAFDPFDPNVPNDNPFITRRVASCAQGACSWTFLGPTGTMSTTPSSSSSPTPSSTPTPSPPPTPSPSPTPSDSSTLSLSPSPSPTLAPPPAAAGQADLPRPALYGIIGGLSFLVLALGVGAFLYFCYCVRMSLPAPSKTAAGDAVVVGGGGGEKAVANPLANVAIVQEPPSSPSTSYNDLPGTPTSSSASIQEWSK